MGRLRGDLAESQPRRAAHSPWTLSRQTLRSASATSDGRRSTRRLTSWPNIRLRETIRRHGVDRDALAPRLPRAAGIRVGDDDSWSDIFSRVLVEKIEPALGLVRRRQSFTNIRRTKRRSPARRRAIRAVAERFELYACGVELANGFGELTDAARTAPPFRNMDGREERTSTASAIRSTRIFLPRWSTMPPASGCALGFDRLVMLATGAERVDQVIWTPLPEGRQVSHTSPLPIRVQANGRRSNAMPNETHTGGCQCGAVRFRVEGHLGDASVCHCRMCQKAFGGFYAPLVSLRDAQTHMDARRTEKIPLFELPCRAASAADCGTPLTYEAPDGIAVAIGAFDTPARYRAETAMGHRGQIALRRSHSRPSRNTIRLAIRTPRRF